MEANIDQYLFANNILFYCSLLFYVKGWKIKGYFKRGNEQSPTGTQSHPSSAVCHYQ